MGCRKRKADEENQKQVVCNDLIVKTGADEETWMCGKGHAKIPTRLKLDRCPREGCGTKKPKQLKPNEKKHLISKNVFQALQDEEDSDESGDEEDELGEKSRMQQKLKSLITEAQELEDCDDLARIAQEKLDKCSKQTTKETEKLITETKQLRTAHSEKLRILHNDKQKRESLERQIEIAKKNLVNHGVAKAKKL